MWTTFYATHIEDADPAQTSRLKADAGRLIPSFPLSNLTVSFHMSSSESSSTLIFAPLQADDALSGGLRFPSRAESPSMSDAEVKQWLTNLQDFEKSMAARLQARLDRFRSENKAYIVAHPAESQLYIEHVQEGLRERLEIASRLSNLATAPDIDFGLAGSLFNQLNETAKDFDPERCNSLAAAERKIHEVLRTTITGTIEAGSHTGSNRVPQPNNGLLSFIATVDIAQDTQTEAVPGNNVLQEEA